MANCYLSNGGAYKWTSTQSPTNRYFFPSLEAAEAASVVLSGDKFVYINIHISEQKWSRNNSIWELIEMNLKLT